MLILVVLSLLILFVVIAVMFVIVATRARAVARAHSEFNRTGDTPEEIVYGVALDLIRGSLNPHSPFRTTSVLEDMYGHQTVRGMVSAAAPSVVGGHGGLVDILATQPAGTLTPRNPLVFSTVKDAYSGCVLTFITGPAKGTSARILEYWPAGTMPQAGVNDAKFRLFLLRNEYGNDQPAAVQNNSQFIINGRAFSGTGIGYNADPSNTANLGRVNALDANQRPYALLPNPAYFLPSNPIYGTDPAGFGGANEDYDAPDFQNPFLAFYATPNIDPTIPNAARQIKPSFHDPALLQFWARQPGAYSDIRLYRQVSFRPNPVDHPIFHASANPQLHGRIAMAQNPNFELGPWDIDNDGDGVPDSVWVDPGYPVQMTAQGRLYKPLAAVLILDLDGRFNVNAHGSLQQLVTAPTQMPTPQTTAPSSLLAGGATFANPPRGSGYGPAEIRIDRVLPGSASAILQGGQGIQGRYGQLSMPGQPNMNDGFSAIKFYSMSDLTTDRWPGRPGGAGGFSAFGSPPDLKGRLAVALDPTGQPAWDKFDWTKEREDNPYEIDLSRYSARGLAPLAGNGPPYDSPFSIGELERILRPNDIDSGTLPMRLGQLLTQDLTAVPFRRNELTTDSWDPPVPSILTPAGVRRALTTPATPGGVPGRITSLAELLHVRLLQGGLNQPNQIVQHIDGLLSPEVRRGLRMDLNRPFGNGVDNSANPSPTYGVVDDAAELLDTFSYQAVTGQNQQIPFDAVNADLNGDGQRAMNDRFLYDSRQLLARHLYVLMMLCTDDNFVFPVSVIPGAPATPKQAPAWGGPAELDPATHAQQLRELKAVRLAQWAINVVDFRDPDNIMTPFPFDLNPFNGWDPTGPERGFVWGCETPVLLLTETLALHDRRVVDTDHDDGKGKKRDDMTDPDPTLDQQYIPRGSAFVELMAIFNANAGVMSADLFTYDQNRREWLLDLGKVAPGGKPVWRLAVTEFHTGHATDQGREPVSDIIGEHPDTVSLQPSVPNETPVVAGGAQPQSPWNFSLLDSPLDPHDVKIERIVFFSNTLPPAAAGDVDQYYATTNNARLQGFQYAIVGPGGTGGGRRESAIVGIMLGGNEADDFAQVQQIRLDGNVTFKGTANDTPQANIKPPVGIPVASAPDAVKVTDPEWAAIGSWGNNVLTSRIGFSISEPRLSNYYAGRPATRTETNLEEIYGIVGNAQQKSFDQPFDSKPGMPLKERDMLKTGTYMNVRTVFLQRLADPTQPWHARTNPYITVDWMPIDLTVFNGEDRYPDGSMVPEELWDPDDPSPNSDTNPNIKFSTRERGRYSTGTTTSTDFNIWTPVSEEPVKGQGEPSGPVQNYFRHKLVHSLGHLNRSYGPPQASPSPYHLGGPAKPFPWIRWGNRPFSNALELMEVPASTPARLCLEFNYVVTGGATATTNPYDVSPDQNPYKRQFNHLLNFFRATREDGTQPGGDFYRIFDFVHVPSPFVGTETMLDPLVFHTPDPNNPTPGAGGPGTENFRAPFNWVSNYRDPGKINLNTINSQNVWNALTSVLPGQSRIPFGVFWATRRGGSPPTQGQIAATPVLGLPTIMPSPFRSGGGGDMVPDLPTNASQPNGLKRKGVSLTLLRETPSAAAAVGAPLLANPQSDPNANTDFANANRNATFRYQQLQRLANLTTTRSNVYAIWITVGYFEVFPNPGGVDAGHPDGYQLGVELGSDTGQIERHRGFYVLDRSIPVGFERGFNHNVERALVLKRFIE